MTPKQIEIEIRKIIFKHFLPSKHKIFLFGSRASITNRRFSDYDIGIIGKKPIPSPKISAVKEELEESKIPVVVDVVDFSQVDPEFKHVAMQKIKLWSS